MKRWERWVLGAGLVAALALLTMLTMLATRANREVHTTAVVNSGTATSGVTVQGEGTVKVVPDTTVVTLGVNVRATTVEAARSRAAQDMQQLLQALKAKGVDTEKDVKTVSLYLNPEYTRGPNGGAPDGYRLTELLQVTVRNTTDAGPVIDAAVKAVGDDATLQGISFTSSKIEALRSQARELAMQDALQRAQTLARAGGITLGKPVNVVESGGTTPIPYLNAEKAAPAATISTPPGELEVKIDVTVTYSVG